MMIALSYGGGKQTVAIVTLALAGPMTINEPRDGAPPKAREEE